MTEIALKIANQVIQLPEPRPRLVAGSVGVYAVTLAYDAQWDDATVRVVVFDGGLCNQRVPVQDTSGTVPIPPECIAHGGRGNWLQIGVLGYDGTGALRITTRAMLDGLRIDPAGASDADVPQEPPAATPGLWEKLVADVGNLSDLQTSDTSSLVAAINELAAKPAGYKPYPIALTQNGNKWTADHAIAEVKEALAQGYSPYCVYNSWPIPCTGVEDNFIYYTGWLGNQTTAVWIMQSKSGVTVVARNTFGVDRLSNLIDSDGGFGGLNALIATNPRTAVVYALGGTPSDGQDLSAMTFPALLWGTATDATARTQTFGLTGAGGDQWRGVQNFDTKAVTFEQVGADASGGDLFVVNLTQNDDGELATETTWQELQDALSAGRPIYVNLTSTLAGLVGRNDSYVIFETVFYESPEIIRVARVRLKPGENGEIVVALRVEPINLLTLDDVVDELGVGTLRVTITGSGTTADPYVSNVTPANIHAALNAGLYVYAVQVLKDTTCRTFWHVDEWKDSDGNYTQNFKQLSTDGNAIYDILVSVLNGKTDVRIEEGASADTEPLLLHVYSSVDQLSSTDLTQLNTVTEHPNRLVALVYHWRAPGQGVNWPIYMPLVEARSYGTWYFWARSEGTGTWSAEVSSAGKVTITRLGTDHTLGLTSATVGQIAKITAVDDNGAPTAWEAVNVSAAVSNSSTDDELATAKAVYDAIAAAIGSIDTLVGTGEVTT